MQEFVNKIIKGDSLFVLKRLPDKSVHCIVTSPPYWCLRDYKVDPTPWPEVSYSLFGFEITIPAETCCLGLEKDLFAFIGHLVLIFRECRRVLRDDGTMWVNMGDSYLGNGAAFGSMKSTLNGRRQGDVDFGAAKRFEKRLSIGKSKDLAGVPWTLALVLREDGWYLRSDIIWHKNGPMPESMKDRPTKSHEYIFLLAKSKKYYYDANAIKTPIKDSSVARLSQDIENQKGSSRIPGKTNGPMKDVVYKNLQDKGQPVHSMHVARLKGEGESDSMAINGSKLKGHSGNYDKNGNIIGNGLANKRTVWNAEDYTVWTWIFENMPEIIANEYYQKWLNDSCNLQDVWSVSTQPFKEAHFATFPEKLIRDCIKAGCPVGGIVLDIFGGSGTTAVVAGELQRKWILIEIGQHNIDIAERRIHKSLGLFKSS